MDPGHAEAYRALADLDEKRGDLNAATHAWADYHGLVPSTGPEAAEAEGWLKEHAGLVWRTSIPYAVGRG